MITISGNKASQSTGLENWLHLYDIKCKENYSLTGVTCSYRPTC